MWEYFFGEMPFLNEFFSYVMTDDDHDHDDDASLRFLIEAYHGALPRCVGAPHMNSEVHHEGGAAMLPSKVSRIRRSLCHQLGFIIIGNTS